MKLYKIFLGVGRRGLLAWMPDKMYINIAYYLCLGKRMNWKNPTTYNEKLQWLKVYNRNNDYCKMVDKYEAKEYISKLIGEEYIIPTLGIYNKFDDIDFDKLPKSFVIKCTHDSGSIVIVKDKDNFDKSQAKKIINKGLKNNAYYYGREWPYKNVKPRIIIEKYMEDKKTKELRDYKFFCFNGIPKMMYLATDRQIKQTKFNFYDLNFNFLPFQQGHPNDLRNIDKPNGFDKMIELSKKVSKNIPHVRVDWYEINGKIYFGELTFFHMSGFDKFEPEKWDKEFGDLIDTSKI